MPENKDKCNRRMKALRNERKSKNLCVRCGLTNDRLPKVSCSQCATKAAFEYDTYREKRNVTVVKAIRLLQARVTDLENQIREINERR